MKKSNQILLSLVITSVLSVPAFAQSTKPIGEKNKSKRDTTESKHRRMPTRGVGSRMSSSAAPRHTTPLQPAPARITTPSAHVSTPHVSAPSSAHVTTGGFGSTASHSSSHASS